jgi:NitT/TauT family transport system ATP-binding protein
VRGGGIAPTQPLIAVNGLRKEYAVAGGGRVLALDNVSFDLPAGEFLAVVGPSGCGKTTLLRILAGLQPGSGGRVALDGRPVAGPSDGIGVVFQEPVLMPWRTVFQNVILPLEIAGTLDKAGRARADELLTLVGLADFRDHRIWELSGGMQQRVAIARALVADPLLLLMDEPFGALDAMTREQMNVELQRICAATAKTTVFVTHNLFEAVFLADRVLVLTARPGRVRALVPIELPERTLESIHTPQFGAYVKVLDGHIKGTR